MEPRRAELKQELRGWQLFFIVFSSVIGTGVFTNNGEALRVAGPGGLLLAVFVLGVVAIFVGETISELVQRFPAPNAAFEYVAAFVDEELAWVVAVAYWYTFASVFASQILGAAKLLAYWDPAPIWPPIIMFLFVPWILFAINLFGVKAFGWIEAGAGALKVVMLFGVSCILWDIARKGNKGSKDGTINEGFTNNPNFASDPARAFCFALPAVAYGYLGIETVIMAAYEGKRPSSVATPSRLLPITVVGLYLLCTLGIALTVERNDPHLPPIAGGLNLPPSPDDPPAPPLIPDFRSNSAVIIAIYRSGQVDLAGFINGCLIFSILSAANTSLYIASRNMYGFTYALREGSFFKGLSELFHKSRVPGRALFVTVISFWWMPWLHLRGSITIDDVLEVISLTSSVSCLLVWAALCLAFIRYQQWTRQCVQDLAQNGLSGYHRKTHEYQQDVSNYLSFLQPAIAYLGICGCLAVFAFASAAWWDTPATWAKVLSAFGAQTVALILWVGLKVYRGKWKQWWVPIGKSNYIDLERKLLDLRWKSEKRVAVDEQHQEDLELDQRPDWHHSSQDQLPRSSGTSDDRGRIHD